MGRCESATASIGIKILLSDLLVQINETNYTLIKKMLEDGCIEDGSDSYNDVYQDIIEELLYVYNNDSTQYIQCKERLIKEFKSSELFDTFLLVPITKILQTERWGYDISGTNSVSRQLDFDFNVEKEKEKYKDITNFTFVFFLIQCSG